jgi:hypothetical protein
MPTVLSTDELVIPRRFNGPPQSANGGIACGAVARFVDGPAEVSLRTPPPLDTPLEVDRAGGGEVTVWHGDTLVARARPAGLDDIVPPVRPTVAQAREAMRNHPWLGEPHVLSDCFVCGPGRHDGLGVHFGPLPGWPKLTAALLVADATLPHGPPAARSRPSSYGPRSTARATRPRSGTRSAPTCWPAWPQS